MQPSNSAAVRLAARRREERRSGSIRTSHESAAGNLSPGRAHHSGRTSHRHDRGSDGGGFFASLFGGKKNKQSSQQQGGMHMTGGQGYPDDGSGNLHMQAMQVQHAPQPSSTTASPSRFKQLLSFAPGKQTPRSPGPAPHQLGGGPDNDSAMTVKDLQHKQQLLQAQLQDYERLKAQHAAELRNAQDWKEKWNYQNFKLNVMVDMLVLRVLELDPMPRPAAA